MNEKKKIGAREAGWATVHFHFVLGHNTANCIVTQAHRGAQQGATIRPATLRHGPMTRPRSLATRPACARGLAAKVCHDTIVCIMTGRRPGVSTQSARGCDTAQQRPMTRRYARGLGTVRPQLGFLGCAHLHRTQF